MPCGATTTEISGATCLANIWHRCHARSGRDRDSPGTRFPDPDAAESPHPRCDISRRRPPRPRRPGGAGRAGACFSRAAGRRNAAGTAQRRRVLDAPPDLSEPGGYFRIADNYTSNEGDIGFIVTALRRAGIQGGVYLGVGPRAELHLHRGDSTARWRSSSTSAARRRCST